MLNKPKKPYFFPWVSPPNSCQILAVPSWWSQASNFGSPLLHTSWHLGRWRVFPLHCDGGACRRWSSFSCKDRFQSQDTQCSSYCKKRNTIALHSQNKLSARRSLDMLLVSMGVHKSGGLVAARVSYADCWHGGVQAWHFWQKGFW